MAQGERGLLEAPGAPETRASAGEGAREAARREPRGRLTLSGRCGVVTGANSGIGLEIARGLAAAGARVVLACRSREKGEAARGEIRSSTGNDALLVGVVDLASQTSIRNFARGLIREVGELHILVNNAGIFATRRRTSPDGIELTWATNQLGYFLLTRELLPALSASAGGRIVNVASELARDLDLDDVEFQRRRYDGLTAYAQSKQANRMLTWALDRRTGGTPAANAVHPGGVATPLISKGGGLLARLVGAFMGLRGRSPAEGADTPLWLAASPDLDGVSGRFWVDRKERSCRFRDPDREERLWSLCEAMTS